MVTNLLGLMRRRRRRVRTFAWRIKVRHSVAQSGATLARWMGLNDGQIDGVFPDWGHFNRRDLGLLSV